MPPSSIVLSMPVLHQAVRCLTEDPEASLYSVPGVSRVGECEDWLVGRVIDSPEPVHEGTTLVRVEGYRRQHELATLMRTDREELPNSIRLVLGMGDQAGKIRILPPRLGPIAFRIAGPPMTNILLYSHGRIHPAPSVDESEEFLRIWSRTIGALSEETWRRLTELKYLIVGAGRSGSLALEELCRLGCRRISIVDRDVVEWHNLGEMAGLSRESVGLRKVVALRDLALSTSLRPMSLSCIPRSILHPEALIALKQCEVVISCLDNDAARLAVAFLASIYLKPTIDIGTGVLDEGGLRQVGADVRLTLPGERCLHCLGGLPGLRKGEADGALGFDRQGSLHPLNALAVRYAVLLLQDAVAGSCCHSTWLHLEAAPADAPSIRRVDPPPDPTCPICRLAGSGDTDIERIREIREQLGG